MEDITVRLDRELENIKYHAKVKENLLLTTDDVRFIFRLIREEDLELVPVLDIMETLMLNALKTDYLTTEKQIIDILKYYNIIEINDLIHCRHKYFFGDNKKLIKKPFFCPEVRQRVKDEMEVQNIFKKI